MRIDSITLREIRMRLKEPFRTSFGVVQDRRIILVEITADGVIGWGEVTALEGPYFNPEATETAWTILSDFAIPLVVGKTIPNAANLPKLLGNIRGHEMAKAGLENALWDAESHQQGIPLWKLLKGTREDIPCGVSLGIRETPLALVQKVREELQSGYQRIKLKISPCKDIEFVAAVRREFPDIMLSVDGNSAYSLKSLSHLQKLDEFKLLMIEQPLGWDDIYSHVKLQAQLETSICLDECIRNSQHALAAIELAACRIINIKLGRVSGHSEARRIHDICHENSIPVWCGGMLESGIGRAHNIAMATMPGFTLPGDISASHRYWAEDIIEPLVVVSKAGTIRVPQTPGLGFSVKRDLVKTLTKREKTWKT
jgi:O-succinylbenzoate synthase